MTVATYVCNSIRVRLPKLARQENARIDDLVPEIAKKMTKPHIRREPPGEFVRICVRNAPCKRAALEERMMQQPSIEVTVQSMIRVYGVHAADEAKRMADRVSLRPDPRAGDFWQRVYLALSGPVARSGIAPATPNRTAV